MNQIFCIFVHQMKDSMSPRPRNIRAVFDPPKFKGYKPVGYCSGNNEPVILLFEEYTAIRLCDYELMTQAEAGEVMQISRPTFTRLYESARRKIAAAFVEARPVEVEQGMAGSNSEWLHCDECHAFFNRPAPEFFTDHCPVCQSPRIRQINHPVI